MQSYEEIVKLMVSEKRFYHSQCVAREAMRLASIYGEDAKRAYTAAILHDICKDFPRSVLLQMMVKAGIICDNVTFRQPQIWHGIAGAVFAEQQLNITDPDILNAIRYHTTARAGMSRLEQIIYVADLTSSDRHFPEVDALRRLAERSLDEAMLNSLSFIVEDFARQCMEICPDTYNAYNEYCTRAGQGGLDQLVYPVQQQEPKQEEKKPLDFKDIWPGNVRSAF